MISADLPWIEPFLAVMAPLPARLALVGGAVRDLLLHRRHNHPWIGLPDLDLVVDLGWPGDRALPPAHRLAMALEAQGQVSALQLHAAYGTAELVFQGFALDLASARQETYPGPGENPCVNFAELEQDLSRRDFTINAMALVFLPQGKHEQSVQFEPLLVDPAGGLEDLAARRLRFLHTSSVSDDPTRLVRAARYAARLGFLLAPESLQQVRQTLADWPWRWTSGDDPSLAPPALATRLRMELELLLEREPWPEALGHLQAWGGLILLDVGIQNDAGWLRRLQRAQRFGVPLLPALLVAASDPLGVAERLQVPHRMHRLIQQWLSLRQRLQERPLEGTWQPSRWCGFLEAPGLSAEAVALALASGLGPRRPLLRWLLRWRHSRSPQSAAQLIASGVPRGPDLGRRLQELRAAALDAAEGDSLRCFSPQQSSP